MDQREQRRLVDQIANMSDEALLALEQDLRPEEESVDASSPAKEPSSVETPALSSCQKRFLFLAGLTAGAAAYNCAYAITLDGNIDPDRLSRSFDSLVRIHPGLVTTFPLVKDKQVPVADHTLFPGMNVMAPSALSNESGDSMEKKAQSVVAREASTPFDLSVEAPTRATLIQVDESRSILSLVVHHVTFDEQSLDVLVRDLFALYQDSSSVIAPSTPPPYSEYVASEAAWMDSADYEIQRDHWEQTLAGRSHGLSFPTKQGRPHVQTYNGQRLLVDLTEQQTSALKRLASSHKTTVYITLLSALAVLISRYSGEENLTIGSPVSTRTDSEFESVIGAFINTLAIPVTPRGELSFLELMIETQREVLSAIDHRALPFDVVAERVQNRDPSFPRVFQVLLGFSPTGPPALQVDGISGAVRSVGTGSSKVDLNIDLADKDGELEGWIEYNTDLFEPATVNRVWDHMQTILEAVCSDPTIKVSAIPMLTPRENKIHEEWTSTARVIPEASVVDLFYKQVQKAPSTAILKSGSDQLTYDELNNRSNQLANHLKRTGLDEGTFVGLMTERGSYHLVAMLGILKAGAVYVPLDPDNPPKRLAHIADECDGHLVICDATHKSEVQPHFRRTVCLESDWDEIAMESESNVPCIAGPMSPAHAMYTSGSTGIPKGVVVPHRAIVRLVVNTDYIQIPPNENIAWAANLAFDASTFEIWGSLLNGATLVPLGKDIILDSNALARQISDEKITTMFLTTALLNSLSDQNPSTFSRLSSLVFGGERINVGRIRAILAASPPKRLVHTYGPTEVTTFATWHVIESVRPDDSDVPIGRPIANTTAKVLDSKGRPVPIGTTGELYLGGIGVALGYHDRPDETTERFLPDSDNAGILYRTGDLVYSDEDGNLIFVGRHDNQLKIRGHRIELGEIESAAREHSDISEAVAVVDDSDTDHASLTVYYVSNRTQPSELKAHLADLLPRHMVPTRLVPVESIPMTPNGKIDKRALTAHDSPGASSVDPAPETRTAVSGTKPTETEKALAAIFAEVLGRESVGLHDDFFNMGGHSLLTVELVVKVRSRLGLEIPLATFFKSPTVAELATAIADSSSTQGMISLKSGEDDRTFFLVPGGRGADDAFVTYSPFLAELEDHYRVVGLVSGLGKRDGANSVEEAAAVHVQDILAVQPIGPYRVMGECIGGIMAFEIARQLERAGHEVESLLLMDTVFPDQRVRRRIARIENTFLKGARHILGSFSEPTGSRLKFIKDKLKRTRMQSGVLHGGAHYARHMIQYVPKPYEGQIKYIKSETSDRSETLAGWQSVSPSPLMISSVPGDHVSYIRSHPTEAARAIMDMMEAE